MSSETPSPQENLILNEPYYREAVRCLEGSIVVDQPGLRKRKDYTRYVRALYNNAFRALAKFNDERGNAEISPEQLGELLEISTARAVSELEEIGQTSPLSVPAPFQNIPEEIWTRVAQFYEPREQEAA